MEPPAADYVLAEIVRNHIREFRISDRVIDAFMELADGLPHALPGAKRLRPGVGELLRRNVDTLLREADPESDAIRGVRYQHRFEEPGDDEDDDGGDAQERNKLEMWNGKYTIQILEGAPQFPNPNSYLSVYWTLHGPVDGPLFARVTQAVVRAVEATTRGIDIVVQRRNKERRGVGEIAVAKNLPPLMLGKEVGKYLGGKRRKTKAKKTRRRKTRRST